MKETCEAIAFLLLALTGLVSVTGVLVVALVVLRDKKTLCKRKAPVSWSRTMGEILSAAGNALRNASKPLAQNGASKAHGSNSNS